MAATAPHESWPRMPTSGMPEHLDAVLDRAEHSGVDDVPGGAHDEEVAQALVEDDLGGDPRVGAAEDERERPLPVGQLAASGGVLVGVGVRAR